MTDFLDAKRKEIQDRLKELRPLVEEFQRLQAAENALAGLEGQGTSARRARRTSGTTARRGRRRGSGTRSVQALELVRAQPGITIPELAEAMGIKQNYLYRVMPTLADQGLVTKSGRGWHARDSAAEAPEADRDAA